MTCFTFFCSSFPSKIFENNKRPNLDQQPWNLMLAILISMLMLRKYYFQSNNSDNCYSLFTTFSPHIHSNFTLLINFFYQRIFHSLPCLLHAKLYFFIGVWNTWFLPWSQGSFTCYHSKSCGMDLIKTRFRVYSRNLG